MRITELTTQLPDFCKPMKKKYGMRNFFFAPEKPTSEPCVFFGFYFSRDLIKMLRQRTGIIVIVWAGSDSMVKRSSHDYGALNYFRENKDRVFHIAYSHWIKTDLDGLGLEYFEIPVFPVEFPKEQFKVCPLGEYVYHYTSSIGYHKAFYGTDTIEQIQKSMGNGHILSNKFIITTYNNHPRERIHREYAKSFIGVRLTDHDNMALTCVEMALMGRRSVFNGNIPGAIPFKDRSEVFPLIMDEFAYSEPDKVVAEETWDFINLDQGQWLDTDFYK